jgi:hypothetical protein
MLRRAESLRTRSYGSSSRGLARLAPFAGCLLLRPLPVRGLPKQIEYLRVGFPGPTSRSALVVSHHLGGLLRTGAAGLLRPAPGLGVRRVSGRTRPHDSRRGRSGRERPFPRRGQSTLRRVPLVSSRTASLRPMPSCRCHVPERRRPKPQAPVTPESAPVGRCRQNRSSGSR